MSTLGLRDLAFLGGLGGGAATDPYFANVSLLLHGDGTNGSTTIIDSSPSPKTVSAFGNAQISTAQSKFGGSSIAFDGSGDYLTTGNSSAFNLSTEDWTVELQHNSTQYAGANNVLLNIIASPADKLVIATIGTSGHLYYLLNNAVVIPSSSTVSSGTWSYIALAKKGGTTTLYRDGSSVGTTGAVPTSSVKSVQVGTDNGGAMFIGYMDEIRLTKGIARYETGTGANAGKMVFAGTNTLVLPTAPFPDA